MEYFKDLAIIVSGVAACLAWLSKLKWSKEFSDSKNATIEAKDAQIETLKNQIDQLGELNSVKAREYFRATKEALEEYIGKLEDEVSALQGKLDKLGDISSEDLSATKKRLGLRRDAIRSLGIIDSAKNLDALKSALEASDSELMASTDFKDLLNFHEKHNE